MSTLPDRGFDRPQRRPAPLLARRTPWYKKKSVGVAAVALVALIAICIAALAACGSPGDMNSSSKTTTSTSVTASATPVADNPACGDFTVKLLAHPGGNFSPTPLTPNAPDKAKQELLTQNKHEPTSLYGYYIVSPIYGKYPEVKSEKDLVDKWETGACYSEVGKKLYEDWAWYWKQAVLTPRDHMPTFGTITGATDDGQVFQQSGTINDSTGYDVTYPGFGEQYNHIVRDECTQPGKAGVSIIPGVRQSPPNAPPLVKPPPSTPPVITTVPPPECVNGCPPPPCEETGTCPPPPCEETGTCPQPPCEETGTCPTPKCPDGSPVPDNGLCSKGPEATLAPGNGGAGTGGPGGGQPRPTTPKPETTWTPQPETYTAPPSPTETAAPQAPSVSVAPPPSSSAPLPSVDTGSQTSHGHIDTNSPALSGTDFG